MTTLTHQQEKTIVLSRGVTHVRKLAGLRPVKVSTIEEVQKSLQEADAPSLWISFEEALTNHLLRSVCWHQGRSDMRCCSIERILQA